MKHSVAPQSRKAISLAFFCAVCSVMGIHIALRLGRNTSLLIARAKANLLRQGKNPGGSRMSSIQPPLRSDFLVSFFSGNGGRRRRPALGTWIVSSLGLQPEGQLVCALYVRVVQRSSWGSDVVCAHVSCKGDKVLCVFLRLLGLGIDVVRGSCTFCRLP